MLGFSSLFIRQPTPYGISYFHFFLRVCGYGKSIMCGSLGDFPNDAVVSCLVSDQIPFKLLSICSWMCLSHDLPTFYMQPEFLLKANHMQPGFVLKPWSTHFLYAARIPSKFPYLAVISSSWWLQVSCKIKNKVEIRNHVIRNRIK